MAKHVSGSVMYPEPTLIGNVFEKKSWVKFEPAKNNWPVSSQVPEEDLKKTRQKSQHFSYCYQGSYIMPFYISLFFIPNPVAKPHTISPLALSLEPTEKLSVSAACKK